MDLSKRKDFKAGMVWLMLLKPMGRKGAIESKTPCKNWYV